MNTVSISSESQLRNAAARSVNEPIAAMAVRDFAIADCVNFPLSVHPLLIDLRGKTIRSTMTFRGWDDPQRIRHGLQFHKRPRVTIIDGTLANHEGGGQMVRTQGSEAFPVEMLGVTLKEIGCDTFPNRIDQPVNAGDVHGTCAVGGVADWSIYGCSFENCSLAQAPWVHTFYPLGGTFRMAGCWSSKCGSVLQLAYQKQIEIAGCNFNAVPIWNNRLGKIDHPWFVDCEGQERVLLYGNKLSGTWLAYGIHAKSEHLGRYVSERNDFSQATFSECFADLDQKPIDFAAWQKLGMDRGSVAPAK